MGCLSDTFDNRLSRILKQGANWLSAGVHYRGVADGTLVVAGPDGAKPLPQCRHGQVTGDDQRQRGHRRHKADRNALSASSRGRTSRRAQPALPLFATPGNGQQQPSLASIVATLSFFIIALSSTCFQLVYAGEKHEDGNKLTQQVAKEVASREHFEGSGESTHQPNGKDTGEDTLDRCNQCYGDRGQSETPDIPSIGGFTGFAIMELLNTYRLGLRKARSVALPDGTETNMEDVVAALSEEDEWTVSAYYSRQRWKPPEQPFDADMAALGAQVHD